MALALANTTNNASNFSLTACSHPPLSRCLTLAAIQATPNMVFTQGRGFVLGASFGLQIRSLRCRVLVCNAADTASLATRFLFGKLFACATFVSFGEKRCRKNLPLGDLPYYRCQTNRSQSDSVASKCIAIHTTTLLRSAHTHFVITNTCLRRSNIALFVPSLRS